MEKIFGELLNAFLISGAVGTYALITLVLLIVGYFKHLKPYLEDFNEIKMFIRSVPEAHEGFHNEMENIQELQRDNHEATLSLINIKVDESMDFNKNDHRNISVEFSKIKYLIEELARKEDKFFDKNNDAFKEIMLSLTKLETRLDYQSPSGAGGIRKWEMDINTFTLESL